MLWLFIFAGLVAFLVVFGGYTRLTRSGLSIVEWNPVHGAFPPIGEEAWMREFELYQQTPEYRLVNKGMSLETYKEIFYIEWFHRQIARFVGLFYAIPVFYFLLKGFIPRRERSADYTWYSGSRVLCANFVGARASGNGNRAFRAFCLFYSPAAGVGWRPVRINKSCRKKTISSQ